MKLLLILIASAVLILVAMILDRAGEKPFVACAAFFWVVIVVVFMLQTSSRLAELQERTRRLEQAMTGAAIQPAKLSESEARNALAKIEREHGKI